MALQQFNPNTLFHPTYGNEFTVAPWVDYPTAPTLWRNNRNAMLRNEAFQPLAPLMSADLIESDTDFHIHADLPGVEDLDISINQNVVNITGNRKVVHEVDNDIVHSTERSYGKVQRRILLPSNADTNNAIAKFKDGVLSVSFPKLSQVATGGRTLKIE